MWEILKLTPAWAVSSEYSSAPALAHTPAAATTTSMIRLNIDKLLSEPELGRSTRVIAVGIRLLRLAEAFARLLRGTRPRRPARRCRAGPCGRGSPAP